MSVLSPLNCERIWPASMSEPSSGMDGLYGMG